MKTQIVLFLILCLSPSLTFGKCIKGNCKNGYGTFVDGGNKYIGEFKDKEFNGKGTYYYSDGSTYNGMFSKGQFNGVGTYNFSDGKKYEGEWAKGLPNGQGVFLYTDKSISKGHFKNGKLNGLGVYYHPNGQKLEGQWKDDELIKEMSISLPKSIYSKKELRSFVNEYAKNLPIKTDSITTVTGIVLLSDNTILWKYRIDKQGLINSFAKSENISVQNFKRQIIRDYGSINQYIKLWKENVMNDFIIKRNCTNPPVRDLLDKGVVFKHSYFDTQGTQFHSLIINKNKCYQ